MESVGTYIWMILFWASWLSSWFVIGSIRRDRDRWRRNYEALAKGMGLYGQCGMQNKAADEATREDV